MPNEELNLEQHPSQEEINKNLELDGNQPPANPEGDEKPQGSDPLDEIQDLETLRAESKKYRAIANRKAAKPAAPVVEVPKREEPAKPAVLGDEYMKKSDFERSNQKKAIQLATVVSPTDSEDAKTFKADVLENWDTVRGFYTPRRGKATPEDILEDIKDAYVLFNARRAPKVNKEDPAAPLRETKVVPAGAGPTAKPSVGGKTPPNFKIATPPSQWYPKKS